MIPEEADLQELGVSQSPKVRSDSFWGDLANALALAPVYRKPKPPLAHHIGAMHEDLQAC